MNAMKLAVGPSRIMAVALAWWCADSTVLLAQQPVPPASVPPALVPAAPSGTAPAASAVRPHTRFFAPWLETPSHLRILAELEKEAAFDYLDTPLKDVLDDISFRHDIPLLIDIKAFEDYGVAADSSITISLKGVTLHSALRIMLQRLELGYVIRDEVLLVTAAFEAEAWMVAGTYDVSDLLPAADASSDVYRGHAGRAQELIEAITSAVAPDSWNKMGGPADIRFVDHLGVLVVLQSQSAHAEIAALLQSLQRSRGDASIIETLPGPSGTLGAAKAPFTWKRYHIDVSRQWHVRLAHALAAQQAAAAGTEPQVPPAALEALESLREKIPRLVATQTWQAAEADILVVDASLMIRQTDFVHRQITALLTDLEVLQGTAGPSRQGSPIPVVGG